MPLPKEASPPAAHQGAKKSNGVGVTSTRLLPTAAWRAEALQVLKVPADTGVPFHVDDLRSLIGDPPHHKTQLGYVFAQASASRVIEVAGAAVVDGRLVRVWRGVQA
jgi:hypothetical protein